jgi:hypothetical protein
MPLLAAFLCLASGSLLQAAEPPLTVKLASGRKFTANVDQKTGDQLWLRFSTGRASLLRPIAWERITSASLEGKEIKLDELRELCQTLKSKNAESEPLPPPPPAPETIPAPAELPQVVTIRVDAWLANWDADVETDGLVVQLTPLDENGQPVAASGLADIELFAARQRKYHEAPQSGGWMTELMQRWTENVEPAQMGPSGVVLRLPFGAVHPEFSSGVDSIGLVHIRLTIPGSGVFEQSLDGVRLRNWSPVRDAMNLQNGRRFFSTEQTGRH